MIARKATKNYLDKIKKETLKKDLIEQCKDTAKLNLEICNDFKYVEINNYSGGQNENKFQIPKTTTIE
ncbi:MAG TPA: hypothetical protein VFC91_03070 [Atribacterota bacterium]|nr:hypothetical protein [Atribacterota bacterium]